MEPPRIPVGTASVQQATQAKCCRCCKDYGTTVIDLKTDKNFAYNGDQLMVEGMIDHSRGNTEIESATVQLEEKRVVISSRGAVRTRHDAQYPLGQIGQVNPGQTKNFHFQAQVPNTIVNYTAIGRVTARYYILTVKTSMGCCTTDPYAAIHIIINSKTPTIMKQEKMSPPEGWYPQEYPKVVCNNMRPFNYSPLPSIPYHNVPGSGGNINMANMNMGEQGVQPYFQE